MQINIIVPQTKIGNWYRSS